MNHLSVLIYTVVLVLSLAIGQVKGQATQRQLKKDAQNHNCITTNKYSVNELRGFYPFNIAKSVSIVSFDIENDTVFNKLPIVNGEVDYSQIKESKILDRKQTDSLASILYNVTYRGKIIYESESGCYEPRNAVLFLDSNNHLLEFIEICFRCHKMEVSSGKINLGDLCSQKSEMIKDFFLRKGIKVGTEERRN